MRTSLIRSFLFTCLLSLPCAHAVIAFTGGLHSDPAALGAKLTFRRVFKSSTPEFIEISVREDSDDASYEIRQRDDDPGPAKFQVSPALRAKMVALPQQLNHIQQQHLHLPHTLPTPPYTPSRF